MEGVSMSGSGAAEEGSGSEWPRRRGLRLKRRNARHQAAATEQFLAHVAAADIPLPSIEHGSDDAEPWSAPHTPAGRAGPWLSPRFPAWRMDSAHSPESSRPSTAQSTQTSASLFSRCSLSDAPSSQCPSPPHGDKTLRPCHLRKAPWTLPMDHHLWATYSLYLQDPKLTPFRIGKTGIPPSGVCARVARAAKTRWKGARVQRARHPSRSPTPTAALHSPYVEWPHTCAATRARLRHLCKAHGPDPAPSARPLLAPSPTPCPKTAARRRLRRTAPDPSVFSASDMALSLSLCTSASMQPHAPLAQLTAEQPPLPAPALHPRLASPFALRTYGPSASTNLPDSFAIGPQPRRLAHSVATRRRLASPLRLDQSRSSTNKRPSRQSLLEPPRSKRPSLASDFWTDPLSPPAHASFDAFCSTSSSLRDKLFVPRTNLQELFDASHPHEPPAPHQPPPPPPRLASPFAAKTASFSFPNRRFAPLPLDIDPAPRPFASMHRPSTQSSHDGASDHARPSLANRLAYIDSRLKDLRQRDANLRRSESPF
ncbi:hypothetical protein CDD81_2305 [Ophiocordyceps australis]|uniref:Uncharacterized protein n=1 Tax=Ophiocordyceps australis TaxID=1399860 RepID=A0A2C5Y7Q9_9HYPO|nr:hypothetical protein CDD81_2305 [Ophiocordyceps australis]